VNEDTLRVPELVTLTAVGAAPAFALVLIAQLRYAASQGWLAQGRYARTLLLLGLTLALALPLTILGWTLLPSWFLELLPSARGMVGNVVIILALPSVLSSALALYLSRYALSIGKVRA
jgi:hypothetical protein